METNFNFKSQPCTTIAQSKLLLSWELNKETADMALVPLMEWYDCTAQEYFTGIYVARTKEDVERYNLDYTPAWSLDRLLEIIPENIHISGVGQVYRVVYNGIIVYELDDIRYKTFQGYDRYIRCIECIRWLIKEKHINKEYLV